MKRRGQAIFAGGVLVVVGSVLVGAGLWRAPRGALAAGTTAATDTLTLTGTVRDFHGSTESGGHADFEWTPVDGYGHYIEEVQDTLGADGLPVFRDEGRRVTTEWTDSVGRNIISPRAYIDPRPGDVPGLAKATTGGAIHTATDFGKWFKTIAGTNLADQVAITLVKAPASGNYVFDDTIDPLYSTLGGFFPINNRLFGNYSNTGKNFHFTYTLQTQFSFEKNRGHVFTFIGDDDVWVFVDGKLVIDLGGVHSKVSQTIELDRLNWLQDGATYTLSFFFAERHTTKSDFRIETTLSLAASDSAVARPKVKGWQEVDPAPSGN